MKPFHDNTDTPAARLYKDSNKLYCYSEQRLYSPTDFIEKELINVRLESVFYKLWKQLDKGTQEDLISNYSTQTDYLSKEFTEALPILNKFKSNEINISTLRQLLLKLI